MTETMIEALQPLLHKGCNLLALKFQKCLPGRASNHLSPASRPVPLDTTNALVTILLHF
jgi:hypothetical protein